MVFVRMPGGGWVAQDHHATGNEEARAVGNLFEGTDPQNGVIEIQHPTEWDRGFEREADAMEADCFDDFPKGDIRLL